MNLTKNLIQECERRGIQLEPRGQMLYVEPAENTTPELVEKLRQHKFEIIGELEARRRAAWLHISKQIVSGEFEGCDDVTRGRLVNGLRCIPHPICERAITLLNEVQEL